MTGRRRQTRYALTEPLVGKLRVRDEVSIERWDGEEVVILSAVPAQLDDRLTLELPGDHRPALTVSVVETKPVIAADGSLRHRIRLVVCPPDGGESVPTR